MPWLYWLRLPFRRFRPSPITGQADLDRATDLQITAETLGDLEKVIKLAEGALDKGPRQGAAGVCEEAAGRDPLSARQSLGRIALERGRRDPRLATIRQQSLKDLEKAKSMIPTLPDIYSAGSEAASIPGGDLRRQRRPERGDQDTVRRKTIQAAQKAYILRAQVTEDKDRKLADFETAAKADPSNPTPARRWRCSTFKKGENEKAVATLQKLLEHDPDNPNLLAAGRSLTDLKKYDEALKYCDGVIKQAPESTDGLQLAGPHQGDEGRHSRRNQGSG